MTIYYFDLFFELLLVLLKKLSVTSTSFKFTKATILYCLKLDTSLASALTVFSWNASAAQRERRQFPHIEQSLSVGMPRPGQR
jgi:hypothetical protein